MSSRVLLHAQRQATVSLFSRRWDTQRRAKALHSLKDRLGKKIVRRSLSDRSFLCFASSTSGISNPAGQSEGEDAQNEAASSRKAPRICILGGGFGGLYTAVKLDGLMWPNGLKPQVTLIDQNDRFVFKPLLYEILTGTADDTEVAPFFRDLLEPFQTSFIQARVEGVDVSVRPNEGGTILLSDGQKVLYDWLVIAIGARANFYGIPGVKEYAVPFCSFEDVQKIIATLSELSEISDRQPQAVVVGGGYAGVELAASLVAKIKQLSRKADNRIAVTLITDTASILPAAPLSQRQAAEQQLDRAGVTVKTGFLVKSIKEKQNGEHRMQVISLAPARSQEELDATQMEADLSMWTAGNTPSTRSDNPAKQAFPFERTSFGSLRAEPTLRLVRQKRVFALGDDAFIEDPSQNGTRSRFPATAQVAFQQADYVAWNLWAAINNRSLIPFRYQHLGDMMSLGTQNAAIALPFALPKPVNDAIRSSPFYSLVNLFGLEFGDGDNVRDQRLTVDGPIAALIRRLAYWYRQPTNEQKARIAQQYFDRVAKFLASQSRRGQSG